ncbi:hypothetical protein ACFL6Y_09090 [Elusimicrobiota bacterium]
MRSILKMLAVFIVLVIVVLIGGGIWARMWWQKNGQRLMTESRETVREAVRFGADSTETGCVTQVMPRIDVCNDDICQITNTLFLRVCLQVSEYEEEFCDEVPDLNAQKESKNWAALYCRKLDRTGDVSCARLMRGVQQYCLE